MKKGLIISIVVGVLLLILALAYYFLSKKNATTAAATTKAPLVPETKQPVITLPPYNPNDKYKPGVDYHIADGKLVSLSTDTVINRIIADIYGGTDPSWRNTMQATATNQKRTLEDVYLDNAIWLRQNDGYWKNVKA